MKLSATPRITETRRSHQQLMAKSEQQELTRDEILGFVAEIGAAGQVLLNVRDRGYARRILAYWDSESVTRGFRPPEASPPQLDDFNSSAVSAEALTFTEASPDGLETLAAETPIETMEATPASMPPPTAEDEARVKAMFRINGLARQWRTSKESAGYLLNGTALEEARLYADDDPDVAALVMASQAAAQKSLEEQIARDRQKTTAYRRFLTLAGLALLVTVTLVYLLKQRGEELEAKNVKLQDQAMKLDEENAKILVQNARLLEQGRGLEESKIRLDGFLSDAKPAWQALQRGDDRQIRELLARLDATSAVESTPPAVQQRPRPQGPAPQVPTTNVCRGFLWLGNERDPKYEGDKALTAIRPGDTLIIEDNANIRLRGTMPSATYIMGPQQGMVAGGARVRVVSQTQRFDRPAGAQFWAEVETAFCGSVFVQYAPGGPPGKLDGLLDALRGLYIHVPPTQTLPTARGLSEIRIFFEEDRPAANRIAASLGALSPQGESFRIVPLLNFPNLPAKGTIEVWIDLNRLK